MPRLYRWIYKTLRFSLLVVEHIVLRVLNEDDPKLNTVGSQFSIPVLSNLCSISMGASKFETQLRASTLAVRVQLPLGWNTYLVFNSDIVNFVWKTNEGETEIIVLLIFVLWRCFNLR